MFSLSENTARRTSRTVVRYHDYDGEVIAELEGAAVPSRGEVVTLQALRMLEGPPNPDLVALDDPNTTWESKAVERKVVETNYDVRWLEYPDRTARRTSAHLTVVDVKLTRVEQ